MESQVKINKLSAELGQNLTKVAGAFGFDEKLQRILTGPLLVPRTLNTLNTVFTGKTLKENDLVVLSELVSKYTPKDINRETVLTAQGVSSLRRLSLLVNLAGDLYSEENLDIGKLLQDVNVMVSESKLDPLVSSEEMYRTRNYKMDLSVRDFPQAVIEANPELKLEPAYDEFVKVVKSGKTPEQSAELLDSKYKGEHTVVMFEPAKISGLKPVYGMNGM